MGVFRLRVVQRSFGRFRRVADVSGPFSVACSSPKMREEIIEGGKVADSVSDEGDGAKRLGPKRDKTTGEFEAVKKGGQGFLKSLRCVIAGDGRVRGEQFAANSSPVK
jgi:hypothetical protein